MPVAQTVATERGEASTLHLVLAKAPKQPQPPTIAVNTEPQGARVYLDNQLIGETPVRVKSVPGPHELRMVLSLKKLRGSDEIARPDPAALARAQNSRGAACHKLGDYPCATEAWSAAYRYKQVPELMFNIAQARRKSGLLVESADAYRNYLKEKPDGPLSAQVKKYLAQIEQAQAAGETKVRDQDTAPPVFEHAALVSVPRGQEVRVRSGRHAGRVELELAWGRIEVRGSYLGSTGNVNLTGKQLWANLHQLEAEVGLRTDTSGFIAGSSLRTGIGATGVLFRVADHAPRYLSNDTWERLDLRLVFDAPLPWESLLKARASLSPVLWLTERPLTSGATSRGYGASLKLVAMRRLGSRLAASIGAGLDWMRAQPSGQSDRPGYVVQGVNSVQALTIPVFLAVSTKL